MCPPYELFPDGLTIPDRNEKNCDIVTVAAIKLPLLNTGTKNFQMPLYPMIDDRDTATSRDNHAPVWNTRRNHRAWAKYLRNMTENEIPCYAAPARRKHYAGLPPAYTFVSTAEPFYAETVDYIRNLRKAGVKADIDIYPGLFHAFDMLMPFSETSRIAADRFGYHFRYAQEHYFAEQSD